jgi:hypothetical protein
MFSVIALILLFRVSLAQRPTNQSFYDYYTLKFFGSNTITDQFYFVQEVVTLAFAGGSSISNSSPNLTGILYPGTFQGVNVDLGGFFNASLYSSNLNNGPAAINWLDGGGGQPLTEYLSGRSANLTLTNTTNE